LTKQFSQRIGRYLLICHFPFLFYFPPIADSSFVRHQGSYSVLPLTISTFFGDMFSLPDTNVVPSLNKQIDLDELAGVIERALYGLHTAQMNDITLRTQAASLEVLHATVKFYDKFSIEMGRNAAENALNLGIERDPFAALAYASRQNDVALGRQAASRETLSLHSRMLVDRTMSLSVDRPSSSYDLAQDSLARLACGRKCRMSSLAGSWKLRNT
jgi:hypothetical protein